MDNLIIRNATKNDVPAILGLIQELATFEREPDAVAVTEAEFLQDGFGVLRGPVVRRVGEIGSAVTQETREKVGLGAVEDPAGTGQAVDEHAAAAAAAAVCSGYIVYIITRHCVLL